MLLKRISGVIMKKQTIVIWTAIIAVLFSIGGVAAQDSKKMGGDAKMMAEMKKSPNHKLMMAYTKTMADFSRMLRDQALTPNGPDVEFARAAVSELRHNLDVMEALHQKHMAGMSDEMKAKMKMMMDKMEKGQAKVKEHVTALETAVQAAKPDGKQVAMHANDLVKHFAMMMKPAAQKAGTKKMTMKM
jgi:hypothetical protein